ncbi:hypothetical protein CSQ20_003780 [Salmonella enterica subsp. houtenae]|uniref:Molecular chaperone DnaJ n=1 Tax=Salmonella enterica TaxID=28901 RepID=A0A743NCB4_SALER|nr:hypothetical protein [Salmonella enterica subsp. houtenae]HAF2098069.1 hypothetical protein [Salmonella enterica]
MRAIDGLRELQESRKAAAEPVAWTDEQELRDVETSGCGYLFTINPITPNADPRRIIKLYTAPPVPVVPEEMPAGLAGQIVSLLAHNIGDKFLAQKIWNACRTAMLQGSQPVSNRDELQVIGWLRSDYNSDDKRDPNAPLFMLGSNDPSEAWGVKYIPLSGNSPVIPGGWVMVPKKLTAENGAKGVLSGEFSETKFINCPECFGDDECETCDGSGRIEITVPVSWTNIKAIWAKGVEHFEAAPQQENV